MSDSASDILKELKIEEYVIKNNESDLKKKLHPLYDIEQSVHKKTLEDLNDLIIAQIYTIAKIAIEKSRADTIKEVEDKLKSRFVPIEDARIISISNFLSEQDFKRIMREIKATLIYSPNLTGKDKSKPSAQSTELSVAADTVGSGVRDKTEGEESIE